ncbi:unnamed protein product [Chilo suppressalis]|uniref:Nucleoside-diphosphate kinase n=1 Tax=Chilo suppressalis TaxID=168631 RepID=A0ABN8LGA5_CHISP|nr:unnamed protein product [Chilo suppressalis]
MTETDATRKPLTMPEIFIPYLEKYRIYKAFKDMVEDLVLTLPKDHLKQIKIFLGRHLHSTKDIDRIMILVSPELKIDIKSLVKELIKDLGYIVITRRCVLDRYQKREDYVPECISPVIMSEVTKALANKEPVAQAGWLMFDHPCTLREARCLQQDGVLPTVTLALTPTPPQAPRAENPLTAKRDFFQQDFEGLKYAYKATLKEVHIEPEDDTLKISLKCCNAIRACASGLQGPFQGYHVVGAPGVYRVLLLGPPGCGRSTQGSQLAKHFGITHVNFNDLYNEALQRNDEVGEKLRNFGPSVLLKAEIIKRRIMKKDCIELGWVMSGYPTNGMDFENLDNMATPPNRVIFMDASWETCKKRLKERTVDWCTGEPAAPGSNPRVLSHPVKTESNIDMELDFYFSEALAELRAAAGITAVEVNANESFGNIKNLYKINL